MPQARSPAAPAAAQLRSPANGGPPTDAAAAADSLIASLPDPETVRWVPRRKAQVVEAVRTGAISLDEACRRYALSPEEFQCWRQRFEQFGISGLRVRNGPSS